jgi:hypothetical protein
VSGTGSQRVASTAGIPVRPKTRGRWCEMSFRDLCSRTVVTSTHEPPDSRASRLRRSDRHFAGRPVPACACTRRKTTSLAPTPELRCRKPQPQAGTRLSVASPGCDNVRPLVNRAATRMARAVTRVSFMGFARAGRTCRWRPLSHSRRPARQGEPDLEHRGPSPLVERQLHAVTEPETPSIDGSLVPASGRARSRFEDRHCYPTLGPRGHSFRHGLTRTRCALGLAA